MPKRRKSWTEKLHDSKDLPRLEPIGAGMSERWGKGTMVIPAPIEVDAMMRCVPRGQVTTINDIRQALARKHGAATACPITTGIFCWIAAHAAEEPAAEGEKEATAYWRTLKSEGALNPKYPGGVNSQAARLEAEGHLIERFKGNRLPRVKDYQKKLAAL